MIDIVVIVIIAIVIAETVAELMLCGEHPRPIEPSAGLYLNLCEVKSQVLEVLNNTMLKPRWRWEIEHARIAIGLAITIAVLPTALVLFLLLG